MLIEQKVKLSKSAAMKSVLVGVKEGHFVRFYNESLFLWQQWVRQQGGLPPLKVSVKPVLKLNNDVVYAGGLPISVLLKRGVRPNRNGVVNMGCVPIVVEMDEYDGWCKKHAFAAVNKTKNVQKNDDNDVFFPLYIPRLLLQALHAAALTDTCSPDDKALLKKLALYAGIHPF